MWILRLLYSSAALLVLLVFPLQAIALTGDAARFDFSGGVPAIAANNTATCNNQATVRFDFSGGVPAEVYDATATCTQGGTSDVEGNKRVFINTKTVINGRTIIP